MTRSYSELVRYDTFEERFRYLKLGGSVGATTFGFDRYINQRFYGSRQWRSVREHVIIRDDGLDLGCVDHFIDRAVIHHMNPMTADDIAHGDADILDPEFLISTSHMTHNAIHYGDENLLARPFVERQPGDTKLWGRR